MGGGSTQVWKLSNNNNISLGVDSSSLVIFLDFFFEQFCISYVVRYLYTLIKIKVMLINLCLKII